MEKGLKSVGFKQGRGRPRNNRPLLDLGTPELLARSRAGLTREPLDLCLEHGLVDAEMHQVAMRWRWLYSVKFGVAAPAQARWMDESRPAASQHGEAWKSQRSAELQRLTTAISRQAAYKMFTDAALFSRWPRFLIYYVKHGRLTPALARDHQDLRLLLKIMLRACRN